MRIGLVGVLLFALQGTALAAAGEDAKDSKDHPLLTRMPGFYIEDYEDVDFDKSKISLAGFSKEIEGRRTYIKYRVKPGTQPPGPSAIARNVTNAITSIGGKVEVDKGTSVILSLKRGSSETWVQVRAFDTNYHLTVLETGALKQVVVANAEVMAKGLAAVGHITVDGIFFDTGRAELKPTSAPALEEVAKLMKADPKLKLYVVGHTDNVGGLAANMKLSQERAASVVKELVARYGVDAGRLGSFGAGPYLPVSTNRSEDGRSQNRRVEIVEQ